MNLRELHEWSTRAGAWALSFALTTLDARDPWSPDSLALLAVTVYFANNLCNALFGRTVSFPITVRPEEKHDYELARVFSGGYSIVLWLMLVIGAHWHAMATA